MAEKAEMSTRGALKEKFLQGVSKELQGWWTRPAAPDTAKQGRCKQEQPPQQSQGQQQHEVRATPRAGPSRASLSWTDGEAEQVQRSPRVRVGPGLGPRRGQGQHLSRPQAALMSEPSAQSTCSP